MLSPQLLRRIRRIRRVALTVCTLAATSAFTQPDSLLNTDAQYTIDGLSYPAEIIVDEWGIPHLYAGEHYDVYFLQGFNAARDRLWQIDLWRKRGLGQLSETFGADYIEQDEATRLFLYRQDMYSEWLAYGNDAKKIAERFTQGINAYIDLTKQHKHLLPPEFNLLGYTPAQWEPKDVVRIRSNGLWRNVTTEVWRAQWACEQKLAEAGRWRQLEPAWQTKVPNGLDPCIITPDVLDKYRLAKAPASFQNNDLATHQHALQDQFDLSIGSNNWVVAADRTSTGRPILADDPHRGHATPSLRYIAHLNAPGIDVIGAGEPALPGISIGHNHRIAFGLTIFPIDQEDLYVYEKHPLQQNKSDSKGYLYQGRVVPFDEVTEAIAVHGETERAVTLKFTRHGPVVAETDTHAFAVRADWLEPGMAPYFGSIEYMRAENFREFVGALNRWGALSENQVYADVDGNIGYKPAGRFPRRDNWDGLLPVAGDGRYEWQGYFDMDVLPEEYNPERGFTGTANSMNLPADYPIQRYPIGFEWSDPWRYKRLWQVLGNDTEHSVGDSLELQRDYTSLYAQRVLSKLPELPDHPGGKLLAGWNGQLAVDSAAAALWNVWSARHLPGHLGRLVTDEAPAGPALHTLTILDLLDTSAGRAAAYKSLASAFADTTELLGDKPANWRWGDLHKIRFAHPLLHKAPEQLAAQMRMPAYPRGGSANTTNNTGYAADNFLVRAGASFRMVVDVGNWDTALATNAPGQSGDPRSAFYSNLLENWATEGSFPMVYTREAVDKHTAFAIKLTPAKADIRKGD